MPPSADFASEASAESTENSGFRASSDLSLLPNDEQSEPHNSKLKTKETENISGMKPICSLFFACNIGLGLAHLHLTSQMRCLQIAKRFVGTR